MATAEKMAKWIDKLARIEAYVERLEGERASLAKENEELQRELGQAHIRIEELEGR